MAKYIIKRILYMIPVLLGVAFLVFTILSLTPGDPGTIILGITAKPEDVAALNAQLAMISRFLSDSLVTSEILFFILTWELPMLPVSR